MQCASSRSLLGRAGVPSGTDSQRINVSNPGALNPKSKDIGVEPIFFNDT